MKKPDPTVLLGKFIKGAKFSEGYINVKTLNFDYFREIVKHSLYDSAIDSDFLWDVILPRLFKYHDFQRVDRDLTDEEKEDFARGTHEFLAKVPYKYTFYYMLPDDCPLPTTVLTPYFEIIESTQQLVDNLEKVNPPSEFDRLVGQTSQKDNHRLLTLNKKYIKIRDSGLVLSGEKAFLESNYSPDRLVGIFYSLHLIMGNMNTMGLARKSPTPKVYDNSDVYRSNFVSPIKASRAENLQFVAEVKDIEAINESFIKLINTQLDKDVENARKQLCNSLYWYLEYLNANESSLQIVFLVSSLDSLFPPRNHTVFKNKQITPTVLEKAPLIADVTSNTEGEKHRNLAILEELFEARNNVIHGKNEIHGYQKSKLADKAKNKNLVSRSDAIIQSYILKRIEKFSKS